MTDLHPKFIVTAELGKLATWLRILGFDTVLEKEKPALVMRSLKEDRMILTRDTRMKRFAGVGIIHVASDFLEDQIDQVLKSYDITVDRKALFRRCAICNEMLEAAPKDSVKDEVPAYVFETQDAFTRCPRCRRIYWRGTHWALVNTFLDRIGR